MGGKKEVLNEVCRYLLDTKDPKTEVVFIFGAGASKSSGMPLGGDLKTSLWDNKLILRPPEDVKKQLKKIGVEDSVIENLIVEGGRLSEKVPEDVTFEELMTVGTSLEPGATDEEKERKMAEWLETQIPDIYKDELKYFPSIAYEFTCHLLSLGLIKYVISMNYDELLDKEIDDELGKGSCFKVVTLENFESLRLSGGRDDWGKFGDCFLIKPHGTRSMRRSCRYKVDFVRRFEEDKRVVLQEVLMNSVMVLVGYAAPDDDFRNLIGDISLSNIEKIIVVDPEPDNIVKNLSGRGEKISRYRSPEEEFPEEEFFEKLGGKDGVLYNDEYEETYTKATRHFIRAAVYKQINPATSAKKDEQIKLIKGDNGNPAFFERLDLLVEILIYCFKVRGLFTRTALSTCPRVISALDMYLEKARGDDRKNPIEDLLQELKKEDILKSRKPIKIDPFDYWYYLPKRGGENADDLFVNAATRIVSKFLSEKLKGFFLNDNERDGFIEEVRDLLARLPSDFDYDLLKGSSMYFLPFNNIEQIIDRKQFRRRSKEILKAGIDYNNGSLYIMSPSVAEWLLKWGKDMNGIEEFNTIKIMINKDVFEFNDSLHYEYTIDKLKDLKTLITIEGGVKLVRGVKHGLTMAFEMNKRGNITKGKAVLFAREGKASSFSPIFIEENEPAEDSDIKKLKGFFNRMFRRKDFVEDMLEEYKKDKGKK